MNNYMPLHEHFNNVHNYINNHIIRGLYEPSVILLEDSNGSWIQRMWTAVLNWFDKLSGEVKTFYKENVHFRLQPENETFDPIIVDDVSILGKVVASMRYY